MAPRTTRAKPIREPIDPGARPLLTREARKRRTREALMEAALRLMSEGRSFTGLGLREVTREAGVVPTAFYRHFRDELGAKWVQSPRLIKYSITALAWGTRSVSSRRCFWPRVVTVSGKSTSCCCAQVVFLT